MHGKITQRHLEALGRFYRGSVLFLAELGLVLLFMFWVFVGFLDLKTVVSVVVPEMALALIFYYFLGQGRQSQEEEMSNLLEVAEKLSHLKVYTFTVLGVTFYYVENTATKEYYKAPKQIVQMIGLGVVITIECKNEADMRAKLEEDNSNGNEREPTIVELLNNQKEAKTL